MQLVACDAPIGFIEPAQVTSFAIHTDWQNQKLSGFFTEDGEYVLKAECVGAGVQWYRIDVPELAQEVACNDAGEDTVQEEKLAMGAMLAGVIPMGGGRVAFPFGSTGRVVYRVWRSEGKSNGADTAPKRTRIRGVRAARSRRLPA